MSGCINGTRAGAEHLLPEPHNRGPTHRDELKEKCWRVTTKKVIRKLRKKIMPFLS